MWVFENVFSQKKRTIISMINLTHIMVAVWVWSVLRPGMSCVRVQEDRFKVYDEISNRRLLWHGTNVAVVAAILKSGLRIMPHSGGRVGKGIYLASENSKSAGYGKVWVIL